MAVKPGAAKDALVDAAIAHVRERVALPQVDDVARFVSLFYAQAPADDLRGLDLYGAALAEWHLLQRRLPGQTKVRVYTPRLEEHGWRSQHSVVEILTDDMPFLVDSVEMALTRRGTAIHLHIHPVVCVRRDREGHLVELLPTAETGMESLHHVEIDCGEPAVLEELRLELEQVLGDVRAAVDDWHAMRGRVREVIASLGRRPPPLDADDVAEAAAFLDWLEDDHFTFLGYREYELITHDGDDVLRPVAESGLGILRDSERKPAPRTLAQLPPEARRRAREPNLLNLTKANARATVHRPACSTTSA